MNKEKPKLVFLWTYLDWGGAQVYFMAVMKRAVKEWNVIVALPSKSSPELIGYLRKLPVTIEFLDFHMDTGPAASIKAKLNRQFARIRSEYLTLRYLSRFELKKCILHIEAVPWQSWIFLTMLSLRGANVFVTLHNGLTKTAAWRWIVWILRMQFVSRLPGFHLIASNNDTKDRFRQFVSRSAWEAIPVAYTAVDSAEVENVLSEKYQVEAKRSRFGIQSDELVVICVGQFIDRKGRWTLLDASRISFDRRPDTIFLWLTPTMPTSDDIARVNATGLGRHFQVIHATELGSERKDILRFYRLGDIFVLPSFVEGLPISLLEAMAFGLPCISTNVYAIPEAIEHNYNGILIEPGDPMALASEIQRLSDDPELRTKFAQAGRSTVLSKFDESKNAEIILSEYSRCLANAG